MFKLLDIIKKEKNIYKFWIKNKLFNPKKIYNKKNFSIIMPPPNITGNLHIGHAYQQTIMDILIRYKKMLGFNTLWITGTDHAGISTQIIVKNYLKNKKKTYCKKKLKKELWKWKKKYEKKIHKKTKILGSSIYWKNTPFTLDKNFSYSVNKSFIKLYKKKLIYKSYNIINWDIKNKIVLSDLEIYKKKKKINQYFIKYKILNKDKYIIIPTINPENILANTYILINPKNKKQKKLINKYVINPINNIKLKIILNKKIKTNKNYIYTNITPGHNKKHFNLNKKYKFNIINIFNKYGNIKNKFDIFTYKGKKLDYKIKCKYKNLNKKKIIKILKNKNKIFKIKKINKNIKININNNNKIINLLKKQWYLKTKKISKKAIKYVKNNKIKFIPCKYKKLFFQWMKNIKDWCLSRQIVWGHKIPIWYDKKKNKYLGYNKKYIIKKYKLNKKIKLKQDKNVLDTWFSSSLWTFSCLGWPKNKKLFKLFHPINIIVSGYDIIFFWISKMIMITLFLIKKNKKPIIPFKKIFITGLITDENGNKMSKSIGNVIDPNNIIKGISKNKLINQRIKYLINKKNKKNIILDTKKNFPNGIKKNGTDILRYTLASISNLKLKINFNFKKLINSYNYCNKLWNLSKYIIFFYKKYIIKNNNNNNNNNNILLIDYWIIYNFNIFLKKYKKSIKLFRFDILCNELKKFLKNKFCDWYLELFKKTLIWKKENNFTINNIIYIFTSILKTSHPIIPFITEYIWNKIKFINKKYKKSILLEKFPKIKFKFNNKNYIKIFNLIKNIIIYFRKNKIKIINLIIINLNFNNINIIIKNKYLLNEFIKNIYFIKKKNFINFINKDKFIKLYLITNNIYITYKKKSE